MKRNKISGLRLGRIIEISLALTLIGCDSRDKVFFSNQSAHEIDLLVDAADGAGDFNSRQFKTTDSVFVFADDLTGKSIGPGEVVAFNKRRPPFARNPVDWHKGADLVSIPFDDEYVLNYTIWIVDVNWANTVTNRTNETLDQLAYAGELFKSEGVGLLNGDVRVVDATGDPDAKDLRDCDVCGPNYSASLMNRIGFDNGLINIYLTRKVLGSRYNGAALIGGDQILMGMYAGSEDILVHEIAHCFTLEHTNDLNDHFDSKNVLQSGGNIFTKGKYFTEGQIFRIHFEPTSAINDTYSARSGLYTAFCFHSVSPTITCPRVQKRIWNDGSDWPAN